MSNYRKVWDDSEGDLRSKKKVDPNRPVQEKEIELHLRRLTSGKGRCVIEISNLPDNLRWCKEMAKIIKKSLGVGGTYKNSYIEVHADKIDLVTQILDKKNIKWKKTGG